MFQARPHLERYGITDIFIIKAYAYRYVMFGLFNPLFSHESFFQANLL